MSLSRGGKLHVKFKELSIIELNLELIQFAYDNWKMHIHDEIKL
jgi:hypothetical protein